LSASLYRLLAYDKSWAAYVALFPYLVQMIEPAANAAAVSAAKSDPHAVLFMEKAGRT